MSARIACIVAFSMSKDYYCSVAVKAYQGWLKSCDVNDFELAINLISIFANYEKFAEKKIVAFTYLELVSLG